MMEINNMTQLQMLVRDGFTDWRSLGDVYAKYKDGLVLFNYSPEAQYAGRWNYFERVSRGLILDAETGDIVARPFDKFFNWGEGARTTDAPLVNVTEKMDGSLGIAYMWRGKWHVATRGSFDSEQAQWATEWLRKFMPEPWLSMEQRDTTLLFEIIYPGNRVVVDYADRAELVLLAIRRNSTGEYATWRMTQKWAAEWGFSVPDTYSVDDVNSVLVTCATLDANQEGYVAEFADGQRFKFKGDAYKELHRLVTGLSFKNTLDAVVNGKVDEVRAAIPDEFLGQFNEWVQVINDNHQDVSANVEIAFNLAPKGDRKAFAMWVNEFAPGIAPYLFAKLDGRDYAPLIYKREF